MPKTITNVTKVVTTCKNLSIHLSANNTTDYFLDITMDKDMDSTGANIEHRETYGSIGEQYVTIKICRIP